MTLNRILALLLLVALVAAAIFIPVRKDEPRPVAPDDVPAGPIVVPPPPEASSPPERDLARLIRDLGSEDEAVVLAAAKEVTWTELTNAEMERIVPLLWRALLADLDGDVDWNELRSMVGSSEVPVLVRTLPDRMDKGHAEFIAGGLHRMIRADHLPVIAAKIDEIRDPLYAGSVMWELMGIPLDYTNRHREVAARTMLRHHPEPGAPEWVEPVATGPGYPALLETALRRWLKDPTASPFPEVWVARWMNAERPGPKDADVLLAIVDQVKPSRLTEATLRALGHLTDAASLEALRECGAEVVARGALARRGDAAALARLRSDAGTNADALAVLLDVAPAVGVSDLRKRILGETPAAERALSTLAAVLVYDRFWYGAAIEDDGFRGFHDDALGGKLTGHRLARIGAIVPGCRTREMAERACGLMAQSPPPSAFFEETGVLSFLEVGDPEGFRRLLRVGAESKVGERRDAARARLLALGDPESAAVLIDYVRSRGADEYETARLAQNVGPGVEAYLREIGDDAALAVYHGLPPSITLNFAVARDETAVRSLIRDGRPVDALVEYLRQAPDATIWGVGRVRDDRIRAWLEGRRARRQDYLWATGELMLMGDEAARAEIWAGLTTGRYRLVDEADVEIMTLDHDFSTIPHWINDLESNCCRFNVVAQIFEDLFGIDMDDHRGMPFMTAAEVAREFWDRHGDHLVFSRIAGHYVPDVR